MFSIFIPSSEHLERTWRTSVNFGVTSLDKAMVMPDGTVIENEVMPEN